MARVRCSGFIITAHYAEENRRPVIVLWLRAANGPVRVVIEQPQLVFFIDQNVTIPKDIKAERKAVALHSMASQKVDALYFESHAALLDAKDRLQGSGIRTYESDIRPVERYLMERFIHGLVEVQGELIKRQGFDEILQAEVKPGSEKVALSLMSLDIETGRRGELYSIGLHQIDTSGKGAEKKIVLMSGRPCGEKQDLPIEWFDSEKDLLTRFVEITKAWDPDLITGWHVIGFDFKFLDKKALQHSVALRIGRENDRLQLYERSGASFASLYGRVIVDGPWAFKSNFYSFESFKLDSVAHQVLGVGKDIEASGQEKVEEIERRYREDRYALANYNLLDAILVNQILMKTQLIDLMLERTYLSGLLLDKMGLSTAAFDHYLLPRIHRLGYVASNVLDVETSTSAAGGHVFDPVPGLHEHVIVLDFKSLYPSIMRTFHIDPYSRLIGEKHVNDNSDLEDLLNTPAGINFSRKHHLLPVFLTELTHKRGQAKREKDAPLSQAIKILMNSFYGVMGSRGCRFYHGDLPEAITGTGRWILETSAAWFEAQNLQVVYGDTDSLFVKIKATEAAHIFEKGAKLAHELNDYLSQTIAKQFQTESFLEVEFEKYFRKIFFAPLRSGEGAAKKRYAGVLWNSTEEQKGELHFSGLEIVRQDWTKLAKIYQRELYERLFAGDDIEEWTKHFLERIKNKEFHRELLYRKRLSKDPSEYKKNIPPHVRAAQMLIDDPNYETDFENFRSISYYMTMRGPVPEVMNPTDLDYQHYIDRQIRPLCESVLWFYEKTWDNLQGGAQLDLL